MPTNILNAGWNQGSDRTPTLHREVSALIVSVEASSRTSPELLLAWHLAGQFSRIQPQRLSPCRAASTTNCASGENVCVVNNITR
jgi:hypothetical protein